ncbi:MAG: S1 RNA-binding domain-containing protein [Oscillospiraceae bacterium]|nr:S1 RNA-binding domain-containing protein [Oscillospiraceae bacterium]
MKNFLPEGSLIDTAENKQALSSLAQLRIAAQNGTVLEARAELCDKEHNLHLRLGDIPAIIPKNEGALGIEDGSVRDIAVISRVNKPVCFKIIDFDRNSDGNIRAVLSRKEVQLECKKEYIASLSSGDVIPAYVSHMESFGVFLDIGAGLNALMPIDSISISRIPHPNARFTQGQKIKAIVKGIDEQGRITLSHKELLGTWEENARMFSPGETVPGIVRSVEKYGIFIELTPNLAGLAEYSSDIKTGQYASIYIKSMNPERMKIKLIVVDCFDAQYEPTQLKYFTQLDHISHWVYSPQGCSKVIESVF